MPKLSDLLELMRPAQSEMTVGDLMRPATVNQMMMSKALRQRQANPRQDIRQLMDYPENWQQFGENVAQQFPIDTPENVRAAAQQLAMNMGPQAVAYHGSPHKFDKFDASKAGKRGGTSFGLGHNFSEDASHANVYRGKNGSMYKVDIADDAIQKMISWETPVPKKIAKAIPPIDMNKPIPFGGGATIEQGADGWVLNAGGGTKFNLSEKEVSRMFNGDNGEQVYRRLVANLGSEDAASAWLKERGVTGIVNNTERGARNYVVFPGMEKQVKILERN